MRKTVLYKGKVQELKNLLKVFYKVKDIEPVDLILLDKGELNTFSSPVLIYDNEDFSLILERIKITLDAEENKEIIKNLTAKYEKIIAELEAKLIDTQRIVLSETEKVLEDRDKKYNRLQSRLFSVITYLIEYKGCINSGHSKKLIEYAELFFKELKNLEPYKEILSTWDVEEFIIGVALHDIGEIYVPEHILKKEGELSFKERAIMESHVLDGIDLLEKIILELDGNSSLFRHAFYIIGTHHENWDGSGYPHKLKGNTIPLEGRMMRILDTYDTLRSDRPWNHAKSKIEALTILKEGSGKNFDPSLVDVFQRLMEKED